MIDNRLKKDAIRRIGEVSEVNGRSITIKVDKDKNLSDLFLNGKIQKNVTVDSYIEIRKGFLHLIGKVTGEKVEEEYSKNATNEREKIDKNKRELTISLTGYIDSERNQFIGGTKEFPLIGNQAYIITDKKLHLIHNLVGENQIAIHVAVHENDDIEIRFPIDGLFNTHIAIFGNTGSGKSNTLAKLYQELFKELDKKINKKYSNSFKEKTHFVFFDFNGEYIGEDCLTKHKKIYDLTTQTNKGDKLPISEDDILSIEILSILSDATEKTQKPFLKRVLRRYKKSKEKNNPESYYKKVLREKIKEILRMSDKIRAFLLIDYVKSILNEDEDIGNIEWNNKNNHFMPKGGDCRELYEHEIEGTSMYENVENLSFGKDALSDIVNFLYIQLIQDVISNRALNEHIAPVINRLRARIGDIEKVFDFNSNDTLWKENVVVVNLNKVNLDMKKTIPLVLSKKIYEEQKTNENEKSLNIIIDEAHNILSKESSREVENWKDYRLETFEEIIKEGRKFGVFVTISSQRPSDISSTITSQAHNYFIHRLINEKDLAAISKAVSYIDKVTEESIPTLPVGICIFSGTASQMPMKVRIEELNEKSKPKSATLEFKDILKK